MMATNSSSNFSGLVIKMYSDRIITNTPSVNEILSTFLTMGTSCTNSVGIHKHTEYCRTTIQTKCDAAIRLYQRWHMASDCQCTAHWLLLIPRNNAATQLCKRSVDSAATSSRLRYRLIHALFDTVIYPSHIVFDVSHLMAGGTRQ